MANNLRNIVDLEVLTEVPEGATCVVEVDGAAKRAPYGGGGGGAVFVDIDFDAGTCTKTYEEVHAAFVENGSMVIANMTQLGKSLVCMAVAVIPPGLVHAEYAAILFFAGIVMLVLLENNTVSALN